ncbi:MAG TPA: hypothetical protein VJY36_00640 [Candidatus Bathyarchaeia archaeon]|nr:hypothetical protein [Candidatus Bathyarchaeia archaeon]
MAIKKKGVNKKIILAVVLLAVIVVGVIAAVVLSNPKQSTATTTKVGVQVGDTFTYALSGSSSGPVPDTISSDFGIYNATQYYKVTVTAINGTRVTLDTDWVLRNGTKFESPQTIDLASGILSDQSGFYPLYPADMNANQTIYPHLYQGVHINGTITTTYSGGTRETNYYTATSLIYYTQDPTGSTQGSTYDQVYFDKQTGMATSIVAITDYNNPVISTEIIWTLTSTNAWPM